MSRTVLLAATAMALAFGSPALAKSKDPAQPAAPATAAAQPGAPAPAAPPRKATAQERAEADRLDPLARAAFWGHEVEADPRDAEAGIRLAIALRAIGRNEEALQAVQVVLVVHPDDRDALLETARDYLAGGQGFYAIQPLTRLQAQDPTNWRLPSLLGVAYDQVSRGDDAEAAWRQALQLSPNNPAVLSNLAMHFAAKGDATKAEGLLRQAAAQPGATVQVRQNLVLILGMEGKLGEAEKLARIDLPPEIASNNLAYLKAATGAADARSWKAVEGAQAAAN